MGDIKDLSSTAIYAWTTLISVLICVPGALIFEGPRLQAGIDVALQKEPRFYLALLSVGLLYHLYNQVREPPSPTRPPPPPRAPFPALHTPQAVHQSVSQRVVRDCCTSILVQGCMGHFSGKAAAERCLSLHCARSRALSHVTMSVMLCVMLCSLARGTLFTACRSIVLASRNL